MFEVNLGNATQSAGTYFNSVTDSYQPVPAGSKSYGNGGDANSDVGSVWASIGGVYDSTVDVVSHAASSVKSGVTSVASSAFSGVTGAVDSFVGWTEKNLFILLGGIVLLLWGLAASGILPQIGQFIPLMA